MTLRLSLFSAFIFMLSSAAGDEQPNFILFITDDVSWDDLGCYGNDFVKTPHLDALAERGVRFDQAYLTISSCSPSRCSLITSRYPHNTGAPELHTDLPKDQFCFPEALREAGYYSVLSGKNHMGKVERAFDVISKGKGASKADDWVKLLKDRPRDRPFFAWFASADAHRDWQVDDRSPVYSPEEIEVPPYLFDGPETREDLAQYYHEVSRTDTILGDLVEELRRQGIEENTYILYMADNGRPFPRAKARLYDSGIKTPLLFACPGKIDPGVSASIVSTIDIGPTLLELAGLEPDPMMQGVSFAPVLKNPTAATREVAFAEQNWHVFAAHARMVRSGDFLYIRNNRPELQALSMESDPTFPAGAELWEQEAAGKLSPHQRDIFRKPRPAEELYQISEDPHQLANLAGQGAFAEVIAQKRRLLDEWTKETGDTIPESPTPDRQTIEGVRDPKFAVGELPGAASGAAQILERGPVMID
ncbi:MAG: sulfatase [Verrucomicrobiota bacterium]